MRRSAGRPRGTTFAARAFLSQSRIVMGPFREVVDGDGEVVVVGRASVGKTYALDPARAAWGGRLPGGRLPARAAELEAGAGICSVTVARLPQDLRAHRLRLDRRTAVVVDEAGSSAGAHTATPVRATVVRKSLDSRIDAPGRHGIGRDQRTPESVVPRRSPGGHSGGRNSFWEFWTTLPGFLTAIAALITAVVGILAFGRGGEAALTREAWAERANPVCEQYFDELVLAGEPLWSAVEQEDPALLMASLGPYLRDSIAVVADLDAELRRIPAPEMDRVSIQGMLTALKDMLPLSVQAADRAAAAVADYEAGRSPEKQVLEALHLLQRAEVKGARFNAVAENLGAVRCSELRFRLPGAPPLSTVR